MRIKERQEALRAEDDQLRAERDALVRELSGRIKAVVEPIAIEFEKRTGIEVAEARYNSSGVFVETY